MLTHIELRLERVRRNMRHQNHFLTRLPRGEAVALLRSSVVDATVAMLMSKGVVVCNDRELEANFDAHFIKTGEVGQEFRGILRATLALTAAPPRSDGQIMMSESVFVGLLSGVRSFCAEVDSYVTNAEIRWALGDQRFDFTPPDQSEQFGEWFQRIRIGTR